MCHSYTYVDRGKHLCILNKKQIFLKLHYMGLLLTSGFILTAFPQNLEDICIRLSWQVILGLLVVDVTQQQELQPHS